MPKLGNPFAIWAANWILKPNDHVNGIRCCDQCSWAEEISYESIELCDQEVEARREAVQAV